MKKEIAFQEQILQHFPKQEEFVKRIYDQIEQMQRRQSAILTPFLSPQQCEIVQTLLGKQIAFRKEGGYEEAERCRIAFLPYEGACDMEISCLRASFPARFSSLSHRDVLGALLHLGIERELIGDLLVKEGEIFIFVDREIASYIIANLTRIKRCGVHFQPYEGTLSYTPEISYEHKVVSSMRLDVLVSTLAKVSRKKAQQMIWSGQVKVDHLVLEETSYLCNNNSAISIRGHGRFHIKEVVKRTKKDHLVIEAGKYQ